MMLLRIEKNPELVGEESTEGGIAASASDGLKGLARERSGCGGIVEEAGVDSANCTVDVNAVRAVRRLRYRAPRSAIQ